MHPTYPAHPTSILVQGVTATLPPDTKPQGSNRFFESRRLAQGALPQGMGPPLTHYTRFFFATRAEDVMRDPLNNGRTAGSIWNNMALEGRAACSVRKKVDTRMSWFEDVCVWDILCKNIATARQNNNTGAGRLARGPSVRRGPVPLLRSNGHLRNALLKIDADRELKRSTPCQPRGPRQPRAQLEAE